MTCLSPKSDSLCQNCKVAVSQSAQGVGKELPGQLKKTPDQVTRQILYWISWSFPGQTGKSLTMMELTRVSGKDLQAPVVG